MKYCILTIVIVLKEEYSFDLMLETCNFILLNLLLTLIQLVKCRSSEQNVRKDIVLRV